MAVGFCLFCFILFFNQNNLFEEFLAKKFHNVFGMEKVNKKIFNLKGIHPFLKVLPCQTVENIRNYGLWKQNTELAGRYLS